MNVEEPIKMSSVELFKEYLSKMEERIKKATEEDHIIHGYMIYRCKNCGAIYFMNLEKGLEDPTDDAITGNHKPVPFGITCIQCGGDAFHILWGSTKDTIGTNYRSYNEMVNEPYKMIFRNFFWNDPDSDCGVPVLFEPDFASSTYYDQEKDVPEPVHHMIVIDENFVTHQTGMEKLDPEKLFCFDGVNRKQRRHPKGNEGYKRPRSNKKLYEY